MNDITSCITMQVITARCSTWRPSRVKFYWKYATAFQQLGRFKNDYIFNWVGMPYIKNMILVIAWFFVNCMHLNGQHRFISNRFFNELIKCALLHTVRKWKRSILRSRCLYGFAVFIYQCLREGKWNEELLKSSLESRSWNKPKLFPTLKWRNFQQYVAATYRFWFDSNDDDDDDDHDHGTEFQNAIREKYSVFKCFRWHIIPF